VAVEVLRRAIVTSMVPAAPLVPTTVPASEPAGHGLAAAGAAVVEVVEVDDARLPEDTGLELDAAEHADRARPSTTTMAVPPPAARRLRPRRWCGLRS
jgi:hypothetical protein